MSEKFLMHTWSLSLELQFYVISPITAFIFPLKEPHFGLLFAAVSLLASHFYTSKITTFYWLPFRIWQFIFGYFAIFLEQKTPLLNFQMAHFQKTLFATVLLAVCLVLRFGRFLLLQRVLVTLLTSLIITCNEKSEFFLEKSWNNGFFQFLGEISYSLYLYHWPIATFFNYLYFPITRWHNLIIYFGLSLLLATLSTYCFEQPLKKYIKNVGKGAGLALLLALPVAVYTFGYICGPKLTTEIEKFERNLNSSERTHNNSTEFDYADYAYWKSEWTKYMNAKPRSFGSRHAKIKTVIWSDSHASLAFFLYRLTKSVTSGREEVRSSDGGDGSEVINTTYTFRNRNFPILPKTFSK